MLHMNEIQVKLEIWNLIYSHIFFHLQRSNPRNTEIKALLILKQYSAIYIYIYDYTLHSTLQNSWAITHFIIFCYYEMMNAEKHHHYSVPSGNDLNTCNSFIFHHDSGPKYNPNAVK